MQTIDSDQHLYEPRSMWLDHIDPSRRDDALALTDDERGYTWLTWRGERLQLADVHHPGDTASCGRHRERYRAGEPSAYDYDATLPRQYWEPATRVEWLDEVGLDEAVCFPNFGLLWERRLSSDLPAMLANMAAWNRWCHTIAVEGRGRLHPVAHVSLRDVDWLETQLAEASAHGIRMAMVAPAPVDGRPLSHPDHDRIWSAFVEHGISPVFHVADQPRIFDDGWYTEPDSFVSVMESTFLWVPAAVATTDLIVNGTLARHPELRIGIVELSSMWVPQHLLMLDGSFDFTRQLNGRPITELELRPSEYFRRQVRISSFSYEDPARLVRQAGDVFMACSDYPHSEGTADPLGDYARAGVEPASAQGLFATNASFLLA